MLNIQEKVLDVTTKMVGKFFYRFSDSDSSIDEKIITTRILKALAIAMDTEGDFQIDGIQIDFDKQILENQVVAPTTTPFGMICQHLEDLYNRKNHDYGNSFEQSLDNLGLVASIVRLGDKMNRIQSLIKKDAQVKDESIQDTLVDMACYCIMTLIWMQKHETH